MGFGQLPFSLMRSTRLRELRSGLIARVFATYQLIAVRSSVDHAISIDGRPPAMTGRKSFAPRPAIPTGVFRISPAQGVPGREMAPARRQSRSLLAYQQVAGGSRPYGS
jgi:hypothetical protein